MTRVGVVVVVTEPPPPPPADCASYDAILLRTPEEEDMVVVEWVEDSSFPAAKLERLRPINREWGVCVGV